MNPNESDANDSDMGDSEWCTCVDVCKALDVSEKMAGDIRDKPALIDQFFQKLKVLENAWNRTDQKYKDLMKENTQLTQLLETEKCKTTICQKRLKFVQDNLRNFEKLKQVYLNVKYMETTGRQMEVSEKGVQTTAMYIDNGDTISVKGCIDYVPINKSKIEEAQKMMTGLKALVEKREISWALNESRDGVLRNTIINLEQENNLLRTFIEAKHLEIEGVRTEEYVVDQYITENNLLRKLVVKYERRLREAAISGRRVKYPELSDQEKDYVGSMLDPYKSCRVTLKVCNQAKPVRELPESARPKLPPCRILDPKPEDCKVVQPRTNFIRKKKPKSMNSSSTKLHGQTVNQI